MVVTFLTGIEVPQWERVANHSTERSGHDEDYDCWVWCGKADFPDPRVDQQGRVVVRKQLKRNHVLTYFANLTPCLIGMEACGGAHYWARQLAGFGHTVKLIDPQFMKPYV
jgi:transposase